MNRFSTTRVIYETKRFGAMVLWIKGSTFFVAKAVDRFSLNQHSHRRSGGALLKAEKRHRQINIGRQSPRIFQAQS
jgi:hypothetical protein